MQADRMTNLVEIFAGAEDLLFLRDLAHGGGARGSLAELQLVSRNTRQWMKKLNFVIKSNFSVSHIFWTLKPTVTLIRG